MSTSALVSFLNYLENHLEDLNRFNQGEGPARTVIGEWLTDNADPGLTEAEKTALAHYNASALYYMIGAAFTMPSGPPTSDPGKKLLAISPKDPPTSTGPPAGAVRRTVKKPAKTAPKRSNKAIKRPAKRPKAKSSRKTGRRR